MAMARHVVGAWRCQQLIRGVARVRSLLLAASLATSVLACGESSAGSSSTERQHRGAGRAVNETLGKYGTVRLGDSVRSVRRKLGFVRQADPQGERTPTGHEWEDLGLPWSVSPPRRYRPGDRLISLLYRDIGLTSSTRSGVYVIEIAAPGARTRRGVGIGDPLERAQTRYRGIRCGIRNRDTEYPEYPYCTMRFHSGVSIWFGQDPIRSITLSSTALG